MGGFETMKVFLDCFAWYEQSDWLIKVITVFIIFMAHCHSHVNRSEPSSDFRVFGA
jgi:hypothetical protein